MYHKPFCWSKKYSAILTFPDWIFKFVQYLLKSTYWWKKIVYKFLKNNIWTLAATVWSILILFSLSVYVNKEYSWKVWIWKKYASFSFRNSFFFTSIKREFHTEHLGLIAYCYENLGIIPRSDPSFIPPASIYQSILS